MNDALKTRDRVLLGVALALPTLITLIYFVWAAKSAPLIYGPLKFVQFALPAVWIYAVRRERRALLEPVTPSALRASLVMGAAFGVLVVAAGLAVYFLWIVPFEVFADYQPLIRAKVEDMRLATPARFIALTIFYALIHSLLEEYYWRWFVFREFRRHAALAPAIIGSSLGFMAHHVLVLAELFSWSSPLTYLFALGVAIGGLFWAWLYDRYQTLAGPWLSHLLLDAGIFAIAYHLVFGGVVTWRDWLHVIADRP
jgi:membrane protease YdiL (CAAX protease family)